MLYDTEWEAQEAIEAYAREWGFEAPLYTCWVDHWCKDPNQPYHGYILRSYAPLDPSAPEKERGLNWFDLTLTPRNAAPGVPRISFHDASLRICLGGDTIRLSSSDQASPWKAMERVRELSGAVPKLTQKAHDAILALSLQEG